MRRTLDAYYTPGDAVQALLDRRPHIGRKGEVIVEPCVGGGAIAQPFRDRGCLVVTNDLVPQVKANLHDDAQASMTWQALRNVAAAIYPTSRFDDVSPIDWTVTNPPFVAALEILQQAWKYSRLGVAFFLRLSFLEPTEDRGAWLAEHPPDELIVLPRISFTGDGKTDSVACAWMIWYTQQITHISFMDPPRCNPAIEIVPKADDGDTSQADLWAV